MILCHKCSGLLASGDSENTIGMFHCRCISGYVRGFEPNLARLDAIQCQLDGMQRRLTLYRSQGREAWYITPVVEIIARLTAILDDAVNSNNPRCYG
jgi:hypothetical protein